MIRRHCGRRLVVDTGDGSRTFCEIERPWQAEDFAALDPSWQRLVGISSSGGYQRAWLERPRGHSKTTDLAMMCLYPILFATNLLRGIWAAGDRDQAGIGLQRIAQLVRINPWLGEVLDVQRTCVVNTRTGSTLEIISSDASSSWGHLVDFIVCDEVSTLGAIGRRTLALVDLHSDQEIVVRAGRHQQRRGGAPGTSWQWRAREAARLHEDWYYRSLAGPDHDVLPQKRIDELRAFLPEKVIQRVAYNIWSNDTGDLLRSADIDAAITLPGPANTPSAPSPPGDRRASTSALRATRAPSAWWPAILRLAASLCCTSPLGILANTREAFRSS